MYIYIIRNFRLRVYCSFTFIKKKAYWAYAIRYSFIVTLRA